MDHNLSSDARKRQAMQNARYTKAAMQILDRLALIFINTFGITQPTEKQRRHASFFILGLLVLALGVVATLGSLFYSLMHRG